MNEYHGEIMKYFKKWLISLGLFLSIVSCSNASLSEEANPSEENITSTLLNALPSTPTFDQFPTGGKQPPLQCISSFETFAYNEIHWRDHFDIGKILPLPPWQFSGEIFEGRIFREDGYTPGGIVGKRIFEGREELWISYAESDYLIFIPETGESKILSGLLGETQESVDILWIMTDNTVWGLDFPPRPSLNEVPIISKFNQSLEKFEVVDEFPDIRISPRNLAFDKERNLLWIFAFEDGIYSYDFLSQELTQVFFEDMQLNLLALYSPAIDSKGNVFFREDSWDWSLYLDKIFYLDTETNEISPVEISDEPWPRAGDLFVDNQDNLWVGTNGWKDPEGNWNLIYLHPEEYFEYMGSHVEWINAEIVLESSNGFLWFRRVLGDGMAWYDPQTGEGCWFTTEAGTIIEDSNKILWLEVNGKLYSLNIDQLIMSDYE